IKRFSEGKDVYWKSALPESAKSMDRRDNFRVALPGSDPSRIRLILNNEQIHARIVDLSVTGAKLELDQAVQAMLGETVLLEDAMLLIADLAIACQMQIQWLREADDIIFLGVHFLDMESQDQAQVRKFIAATEREILKSRPDK
ncbi:MAG: PilZ domain-containing protein, partial [Chromatiales bacterium]